MEILGFIDPNTLSSIILAFLTLIMTLETVRMREAQTDPEVTLYVQPHPDNPYCLDLILENIGNGVARDVKVDYQPDITIALGSKLSDIGFMQGVSYLAPRQRLRSYLVSVLPETSELLKQKCTVDLKYENEKGKKYSKIWPINFAAFETPLGADSSQFTISDALTRIANAVEKQVA